MTTTYLDSDSFTTSFLRNYDESTDEKSYQVLADTCHDQINVLNKVHVKKNDFEDKLIKYSKNDLTMQDKIHEFKEFAYADLKKK